jgi:hypothetical protein
MNKEETDVQTQLRLNALSQVKYAGKALALWETLTAAYSQVPADVKEAFIKVQNFFIEKEMKAYRNLFTLVTIASEDTEAATLALERFLATDMAVMHFWTHNGEFPGSWLDKDEERIRSLFKKVEREVRGKRNYTKKEPELKKEETPKPEPEKRQKYRRKRSSR